MSPSLGTRTCEFREVCDIFLARERCLDFGSNYNKGVCKIAYLLCDLSLLKTGRAQRSKRRKNARFIDQAQVVVKNGNSKRDSPLNRETRTIPWIYFTTSSSHASEKGSGFHSVFI